MCTNAALLYAGANFMGMYFLYADAHEAHTSAKDCNAC